MNQYPITQTKTKVLHKIQKQKKGPVNAGHVLPIGLINRIHRLNKTGKNNKQQAQTIPSNAKAQKKQKYNTNQIDTFNAPKHHSRQKKTRAPVSKGGGGRRTTKSSKAGLQFPVSRIKRYLKKARYGKRVGIGAGVYLAAVLEYLSAELLELSGNAARDKKKKTINPRHIQLAIRNDEELNKLLDKVTIAQGGVLPNMHTVLLQKK